SALALISSAHSYKRSVYLITDVTTSSWKPFLDSYDVSRIDPKIDLVLIPVGNVGPPNLSLTALSLDTTLVLKGRLAPITAVVTNFGNRPQKSKMSLFVDGIKKQEMSISLEAEEVKRFPFTLSFPAEGISHVRATLDDDCLPQDNVRHLAVGFLDR
ncbi:hypothetical protein HYY75_04510, partial [bacterium]|nr:hypothetical protein [bacterium]